jgi:chromate transporter
MAQNISTSAPLLSLGQLVLYFLKLGTIGFGGPAALVGYMRKDLVDDGQRIDERTYNLSIALAQIMPGPLAAQTAIAIGYFQGGVLGATLVGLAFIVPSFLMVLTLSWLYVAFIGYLVAGTAGAIVSAIGIFLPVYIFTIIPAPWFQRHRENPQLQAFAAGATAAASGAIAGAVVVLGQRAIVDLPTAAIGLIGLVLLWRFRLQEPLLVAAAGMAGLLLWPVVRGG